MNEARYLLDTGVLIRLLHGRTATLQLVRALSKQKRLAISTVTRLEIYAGMLDHERFITRKLLSRFLNISVEVDIAERAGLLMHDQKHSGRSLAMANAIMAATAIQYNLILVTYNPKDFTISGLSLHPLSMVDME